MTYFITSIKKDKEGDITHLMYFHNPNSNKIEPPVKFYSSEISLVIEFIEDMNIEFKTAYFKDNVLMVGSKVVVEATNKRKYLKTEGNKEKKDNLNNLPQF